MDNTEEFMAWLAMCIDESRSQQDEEALLQEEWEKAQGKSGM